MFWPHKMSWTYQLSQTPTCRCQLSKCSSVLLLSIHFSSSTRLLQPAHHQIPPLYLSPFLLSPTMRLLLFAALLGLLTSSLAHNIQMGAHQRECFHEALHKDDKMTVTFQVGDREFGGAGNLEIDFWVGAPCRVLRAKRKMRYPGQRLTRAFRSSVDSPNSYCYRPPWLQSFQAIITDTPLCSF